jgi:hypothetical protein
VCEPVSATLGVLSAASGAASAIGGYQSAQAQAAAQNRSIARRKNQENRQYELDTLQGIAGYNTKKLEIKRDQDNAAMEYQDFKADELLAIDDSINKYLAADREAQIKIMGLEKANEGGRARTYNRNSANEIRRAMAMAQSNLGRRKIAGKANIDRARKRANDKRYQLYLGVANPYRPGVAPSQEVEFAQGPSKLGLIAGVTGSLVQGAQTYNSFAPDGKKIGGN